MLGYLLKSIFLSKNENDSILYHRVCIVWFQVKQYDFSGLNRKKCSFSHLTRALQEVANCVESVPQCCLLPVLLAFASFLLPHDCKMADVAPDITFIFKETICFLLSRKWILCGLCTRFPVSI